MAKVSKYMFVVSHDEGVGYYFTLYLDGIEVFSSSNSYTSAADAKLEAEKEIAWRIALRQDF